MNDIDQILRDYADRWQRSQDPPGSYTESRPTSNRRTRLITGSVAAATILTAVAVLTPGWSRSSRVRVGSATEGVPVASPPLAEHLPVTRQIDLSAGRSGSTSWTFFVESQPDNTAPPTESGLSLGFTYGQSSESTGDDPADIPSLDVMVTFAPNDPDDLLAYGVTSAPAALLKINAGADGDEELKPLTTPALPHLEFFVTSLPATPDPEAVESALTVVALDASGAPILKSNPRLTGPLVPASEPAVGIGDQPEAGSNLPVRSWPTGPLATGSGDTSTMAVARHFAEAALGLVNPQISATNTPATSDAGYLRIYLPAVHRYLSVQAQPYGKVWRIFQVGDGQPGVTFDPGGTPDPEVSVTPPPTAVRAAVSETLDSVVKTFSVGPDELPKGVIHLVGVTFGQSTNLEELLIVYYDSAGQVVGAAGGSLAGP